MHIAGHGPILQHFGSPEIAHTSSTFWNSLVSNFPSKIEQIFNRNWYMMFQFHQNSKKFKLFLMINHNFIICGFCLAHSRYFSRKLFFERGGGKCEPITKLMMPIDSVIKKVSGDANMLKNVSLGRYFSGHRRYDTRHFFTNVFARF